MTANYTNKVIRDIRFLSFGLHSLSLKVYIDLFGLLGPDPSGC